MNPPVFHWFLPTGGDDRYVGPSAHGGVIGNSDDPVDVSPTHRAPTLDYLGQLARAADALGYEGVLTPTGVHCEDAWLTTAGLITQTRRLKFLVAFRPGLVAPMLAAQMAATFQRLSAGRLLLNVVIGSSSAEQRGLGDPLDHDARYERAGEFLDVVRKAWTGERVDHTGAHYLVEGGRLREPPPQIPAVYLGGSSPAAIEVAARHADVYLTWGEPPEQVAEKVRWIRGLAEEQGRTLRFGIRLHTITRDSAGDAWAEAGRLLDELDPAHITAAQQALAASDSVGQQRMRALHEGFRAGGSGHELEIYPNLWAGVGLVRGGAGTALVGSHEQVADRIEEYAALGIEEFVLSGYPHLEEAYWFGEGVLPELRRRGALASLRATA
jgi:alkanesulfonate monooxygenase